jgi:hypothetical protein
MKMKMKHIKSFKTFEARVLDTRYGKVEEPLKDSDTIRVYHGFNNNIHALQAIQYGLTGKDRAKRIYGYESGNNPYGLFVSVDFDTAKKFGSIIIEFQCKVSDLEAPVWKGGSYFVQGQKTQSFAEGEREEERMRKRDIHSKSKRDVISKSDRPELAETIFDNPERQALYIGDLNPNMIRAIWTHENKLLNRRINGDYERMNKREFMEKYGNDILNGIDNDDYGKSIYVDDFMRTKSKLFKPNDDFNIDIAMKKLKKKFLRKKRFDSGDSSITDISNEEVIEMFSKDERIMNLYLYPKQISQIKIMSI